MRKSRNGASFVNSSCCPSQEPRDRGRESVSAAAAIPGLWAPTRTFLWVHVFIELLPRTMLRYKQASEAEDEAGDEEEEAGDEEEEAGDEEEAGQEEEYMVLCQKNQVLLSGTPYMLHVERVARFDGEVFNSSDDEDNDAMIHYYTATYYDQESGNDVEKRHLEIVGQSHLKIVQRPHDHFSQVGLQESYSTKRMAQLLFDKTGVPRKGSLQRDTNACNGGFAFIDSLDIYKEAMFDVEKDTAFAMLTHERLGQLSPFKGLLDALILMIIRPNLNIREAMIRGLLTHPILVGHWTVAAYVCNYHDDDAETRTYQFPKAGIQGGKKICVEFMNQARLCMLTDSEAFWRSGFREVKRGGGEALYTTKVKMQLAPSFYKHAMAESRLNKVGLAYI